jgi:predicted GNAT family N-acyltransferase
MSIVCRPVQSERELRAAYALRVEVFVAEQGCPPEEEMDEIDPVATHFLAFWDGDVAGTARVYSWEGAAKIGRVAVRRDLRRKGVGEAIMETAHRWAKEAGYEECLLHAQTPVIGFYEKQGYAAEGEIFYEAGIPHRRMRKRLE